VQVKIETDGRTTIFGDVVARVNAAFMPNMHIDTDEANACAAGGNVEGEILVISRELSVVEVATLLKSLAD
jgi:putative phosphotransacetylase